MRHGGVLPQVDIAYETWGTLSAARDNAVLILTGLSPGAHARSSAEDPTPGWWEEMIGPGQAIDTNRFHVVCVNSLGSCHGSTGPASIDPRHGERYRLRFPVLTIEDIATAAHAALAQIGITRLRAVVGPSMGGMSALAYVILFPEDVRDLVAISTAARATPFAIAIRSVQRENIRSDPEWRGGEYPPEHGPETGLRLARAAALLYIRYASPLGALNAMSMMNMGGMSGYLNNPMMMQMQAGSGVMGTGRGVDRTAGAAMFLMDQAMAGASGASTDGSPSFDASLAEALQDGAKKVGENLKR